MSRKTLGLFIGLLTAIIGLTVLKQVLEGSPLLILLTSSVVSIFSALVAAGVVSRKRNHFLTNDELILKSKLVDDKTKIKLNNALYKISTKANLKMPIFTVFSSARMSAYSYQLSPKQSYIKFSDSLIKQFCHRSLIGILAHETSHIKSRDSWKSVLRFVTSVFLLNVGFFFFKEAPLYILPLIMWVELIQHREKELEADLNAAQLTALDNILHSLLDNYLLQIIHRERLKHKIKWYLPGTFLEYVQFETTILAFKFLGTHPSWEVRIKALLDHKHIKLNDKEFDLFIKKALVLRVQNGFDRAIDWNKLGLIAGKITHRP